MKLNSINDKAAFLMVVLLAVLTGDPAVLAESPSVIEVGAFSSEKTANPLPAPIWSFWGSKSIGQEKSDFSTKIPTNQQAYPSLMSCRSHMLIQGCENSATLKRKAR